MKVGLVPFWLVVGFILIVIGGMPLHLALAVGAVGLGVSVTMVTRKSESLGIAAIPAAAIVGNAGLLPLVHSLPPDNAFSTRAIELICSPTGVVVAALVSIVGSYLIGFVWAVRGE